MTYDLRLIHFLKKKLQQYNLALRVLTKRQRDFGGLWVEYMDISNMDISKILQMRQILSLRCKKRK
jgi:hypothetical protein